MLFQLVEKEYAGVNLNRSQADSKDVEQEERSSLIFPLPDQEHPRIGESQN